MALRRPICDRSTSLYTHGSAGGTEQQNDSQDQHDDAARSVVAKRASSPTHSTAEDNVQHAQQTGNSGHHVARTAHRQQWAPCSTHRSASVRWMRCRAESISASISRVWRSHSTCTRDRFDSAAAVRDSASCNDAFSAAISVSCADTKHNTRRDAKRDTDVKGVRMEKPVHWLAGMANN